MSIDVTEQVKRDLKRSFTPEHVERERNALQRYSQLRVIHWLALVLSLILTISVWQYSRYQIGLRTEARFLFASEQVADLIQERLVEYELALWGGVATMRTHSNQIDSEKWHIFAENLEIDHRLPGINGIGIIHQILPENLDDYLREQRVLRPDYKIHPSHDGEVYQPITFIEPLESNIQAVGLDMVHEANRHTSLNKARDTDTAQITGPIVLVQDEAQTPGFLFFAPFYNTDQRDTVEARRAAFAGAIYAPFIVSKLMDGVLEKDRRLTAIRITDGDQIIYDEINALDADYDNDTLGVRRIQMSLYGREWSLDVRAGLDFRAANSGFESIALLIAGILIELVLIALFVLLTRSNRRGLALADMTAEILKEEQDALKSSNRQLKIARDKAESVSETKSIFLSTISHEVRTPLTAISGILVLLERANLPEKQSKLVRAGKRASENLIKLLTDVLDSSRLEANAVELWEREIAIKPLVEEWQTLASGMISKLEKDITVVSNIAPNTPAYIVADDIRLSQVLSNLMDNAIRFTEQGTLSINTYVSDSASAHPDFIVIAIQDTGIGIAQDDLEVVFERFRQVDGSVTRTRGGAGLGLAISHDLIELMGGELTVSSELGQGTTFMVHLPVKALKQEGPKSD